MTQSYFTKFIMVKENFSIFLNNYVMKLIYVIQVYYNIFYMENGMCGINILCTGIYKNIPIHYGLLTEFFTCIIQHHYTALNAMKFRNTTQLFKGMFSAKVVWIILFLLQVPQKISEATRAMLGKAWKYTFNWVRH